MCGTYDSHANEVHMLFITGECLRNIVKKSHFLFFFKNVNEAYALNPTPSEV